MWAVLLLCWWRERLRLSKFLWIFSSCSLLLPKQSTVNSPNGGGRELMDKFISQTDRKIGITHSIKLLCVELQLLMQSHILCTVQVIEHFFFGGRLQNNQFRKFSFTPTPKRAFCSKTIFLFRESWKFSMRPTDWLSCALRQPPTCCWFICSIMRA